MPYFFKVASGLITFPTTLDCVFARAGLHHFREISDAKKKNNNNPKTKNRGMPVNWRTVRLIGAEFRWAEELRCGITTSTCYIQQVDLDPECFHNA